MTLSEHVAKEYSRVMKVIRELQAEKEVDFESLAWYAGRKSALEWVMKLDC